MKNKSLIAMMFMTIFSFSLVGCNDQATQKSEPYIEDFTQVEFEKLMKYRDSYVGDNSACLWQDKPTYNCSAKVHNSASSLGQKKKPLRAS